MKTTVMYFLVKPNVDEYYEVINLFVFLFVFFMLKMKGRLQYLVRGETEAAGGIGEYSQVIPQRPARTATAPGRSLSLRPHMLLTQVLERSLGANLNQGKGKTFFFFF